ncbi:MAG: XRE family transcriptional regulator [Parvibaculum sp.]|uniref:helix-turn-helix domain-containing protein n=1 Tax=Parvibaculum sp. TaxID=2024848 RepID=UPI0027172B2D|nr:helix-turn-helix domain-containing protein [Parvibaculum sp.]MDO8839764.1 XRE family transcriptional regulator [Parvibaculum sp.]
MPKNLKEMMDRLPAARRRKIEARAGELIAEEMTLRDLRKARELTQERMADVLKIGQDSVSRLEQRSDLLLSTLKTYVAAMGGSLDLVARFPDRPAVVVSGIGELAPEKNAGKPKSGRNKAARGK